MLSEASASMQMCVCVWEGVGGCLCKSVCASSKQSLIEYEVKATAIPNGMASKWSCAGEQPRGN